MNCINATEHELTALQKLGRVLGTHATMVLFLLLPIGLVVAQPIDLCSYPNGIELEVGSLDQITVYMPANSILQVIMVQECDPERPQDSPGGVYYTGSDAPSPDVSWVSMANNSPPISSGTLLGARDIDTDSQFTITLDACPGTKVVVKCV